MEIFASSCWPCEVPFRLAAIVTSWVKPAFERVVRRPVRNVKFWPSADGARARRGRRTAEVLMAASRFVQRSRRVL